MKDYELEMLLDEDLRDNYGQDQFALQPVEGSGNVVKQIVNSRYFFAFLGVLVGVVGTLATQKAIGSGNILHNKLEANYQKMLFQNVLYPQDKEASLRVARGIMAWARQNPHLKVSDIWMDSQQWRTMEQLVKLADGRVNIQSVAMSLNS